MDLIDISIQSRVAIGISAMLVLFASFLIVFISNQRKKLQYHKNMQAMHEEQQTLLKEQNILLEQRVKERTAELSEQKEALQKTLQELKASQSQLIQKEKMASLGELTSGIAHEIQNPLNFVLNFSEINSELLLEVKQRIASETLPKNFTDDISPLIDDFSANQHKILHHGKRADGIVKNMLQHSRRHAGAMELTDLNELADEYLKLSYHGFRAKHKTFICDFQTSFDGAIGRIGIIPQDIGHIFVNLFNNAFYSMNEKIKVKGNDYEAKLFIGTEKKGNKAIVIVKDNGMGISPSIIDKIFQPFFTTKPTGEATGLGLSLSYDIIKAHQAELKVDSKENEYATFIMELNY
ncbi:MAG TPA: ATP-binding protein [Chitinophagaceae bacterium]|nr:ATP-binding protein [Chitinophagaceae bacterium]